MTEPLVFGSTVFLDSNKDGFFCEIAEMLEYCGVRHFEIETQLIGSRVFGAVSLPVGADAEAALLVLMHDGATVRTYRS